MIRRSRRSLPATIVALAGLAVCALVATSAIQLLINERPVLDYRRIAEYVHGLDWTALPVVIAGSALAFFGLVLFLAAVLPGRALVLPLQEGGGASIAGASRRGIRAALQASAVAVDGVAAVRLKYRRRKVKAKITPTRTAPDDLGARVDEAVIAQLDRIGPQRRPRVHTKIGRV
ncbi:hypothetical protein HFP15_04490 [Amycolatopsis sp. K13G38]|uniref:DUF6286 domain-containing protein n=1 Tax=Amycolatopsis acididurans TaxID=2724524 RepID=A0ABX1IYA7_9PSEU|nr:DUF6286 domain-containing protein [Amycolatopsis acididurans]NKQ52136.1 hypothetical protein [Amycolatopsis acididurans]